MARSLTIRHSTIAFSKREAILLFSVPRKETKALIARWSVIVIWREQRRHRAPGIKVGSKAGSDPGQMAASPRMQSAPTSFLKRPARFFDCPHPLHAARPSGGF